MFSNVCDNVTVFEFLDSPKTKISKYLYNETLFFVQIKRFIHYILSNRNIFSVEVTFKIFSLKNMEPSSVLKHFFISLNTKFKRFDI